MVHLADVLYTLRCALYNLIFMRFYVLDSLKASLRTHAISCLNSKKFVFLKISKADGT